MQKAAQLKPQLTTTIKQPVSLMTLVKDTAAYHGWNAVNCALVDSQYQSSLSGVVIDFGEHLTGFYMFTVKATRGTPDVPLRFPFKFGEIPSE